MAVFAASADEKKPTSSSTKSATTTHNHAAAKTPPARSTGKTRAMQVGQGKKKGLTKQQARTVSSKSHKKGHKKFLLFGKRSS
jgi:hypothetical protein